MFYRYRLPLPATSYFDLVQQPRLFDLWLYAGSIVAHLCIGQSSMVAQQSLIVLRRMAWQREYEKAILR